MHVRFSIPWQYELGAVDRLLSQIGNPKLTYHNRFFCGDIDPKYLDELYLYQSLGKIEKLGFLVISDSPVSGLDHGGG